MIPQGGTSGVGEPAATVEIGAFVAASQLQPLLFVLLLPRRLHCNTSARRYFTPNVSDHQPSNKRILAETASR